ncbi:MAG TPA: DUF3291 domain-containing protein [Egibacteraceae bacterium]|nr:DUF3291 domain-containing protein [Egibacteraceae bacterium]
MPEKSASEEVGLAARHHLAQVNIGVLRAPLDAPEIGEFVAALVPINALADAAPGFIWRLQTEDGDATAIRAFDDDRVIVNMSVWTTLDALADYVFGTEHAAFLRRRREWFTKMREVSVALWWVPAGHLPTVDEAKQRLELLHRDGPSARAFTFREPFPPPASAERPLATS